MILNMTPKANNGTELVVGKFGPFAAAAAGPNPLMPLAARAGIDVSNLLIASSTFNESTAAS